MNENTTPLTPEDQARAEAVRHLATQSPAGTPPAENIPDFEPLADAAWQQLPPLLKDCCDKFRDTEERELFLTAAIGVLSGMLPNVQGTYFALPVSPNLYCFIIGRYGTGKGSLKWARMLGEATDRYRIAMADDAQSHYGEAMAEYHRRTRLYDKGKLPEAPQEPQMPQHTKLYLPANASKTAVMQLLKENDGRGIIFETEGDTLADMLRQDYGNFSDVLRKAFHHEPVSYYRRANNEDVAIQHPCLSVVMSGTHDQLRKLIPTIENGLFSRFCFYILQTQQGFKNPFDTKDTHRLQYFEQVSQQLLDQYRALERLSTPVTFCLTEEQQQSFVHLFAEEKADISQNIGQDLEGTVNRMGLIAYRIAMILAATRLHGRLTGGSTIYCSTPDFENAILITRHLMQYSLNVYSALRKPTLQLQATSQAAQIEECCRQHSLGNSLRAIAFNLLGSRSKKSTIENWVKEKCSKSA